MELYAHGGVSEAEREIGQRYLLDIRLEFDLAKAGASDSLADTISYAKVYEMAAAVMKSGTFSLIESQAQKIATAVLVHTPAHAVTVRLCKLLPPIPGIVAAAGVEIRRERE